MGLLDEAEAVAREAIEIAERLGDRYLVAINQLCLGNTFRDRKDRASAISCYLEAGREAGAISRPDIEGRASRLAALTYNDLAREEMEISENAAKAEQFALQAIGILAGGVATYDLADAWDELGTALAFLDRDDEARHANAHAIYLFAASGELSMSGQLRRSLARQLKDLPLTESCVIVLASFGVEVDLDAHPLELWQEAVRQSLQDAESEALPSILSLLIRKLRDATPPPFRDHALDTLLREVNRRTRNVQPGRYPMLLLTILAWFRTESLTSGQVLRYATLCLEHESALRMRMVDDDIHLAVEIGRERQHLFTFHGSIRNPDEIYLALCLASFVTAFGETISDNFITPLASGPQAFEILAMSMNDSPPDVAAMMQQHFIQLPVAMVGFEREPGEHPTIGAAARSGLLSAMTTDEQRVDTFEVVLITLLQAIVEYCFDGDFETFKDETIDLTRRLLF